MAKAMARPFFHPAEGEQNLPVSEKVSHVKNIHPSIYQSNNQKYVEPFARWHGGVCCSSSGCLICFALFAFAFALEKDRCCAWRLLFKVYSKGIELQTLAHTHKRSHTHTHRLILFTCKLKVSLKDVFLFAAEAVADVVVTIISGTHSYPWKWIPSVWSVFLILIICTAPPESLSIGTGRR